MSYSEGLVFEDCGREVSQANSRSRSLRWARAYKAVGAALRKERDLQVAAHLRAAMDNLRIAEELSYGSLQALHACSDRATYPCATCVYAREQDRRLKEAQVNLGVRS